ncbi:MAG: Kelch repeat-containing protein, partial [Candidatus Thorarchaeota archaeon]
PYPPARSNLGMVYCNETNEIIVYGGGQAIDTWSFDCETQTWSEIVTVTNPGIHYSHAMAYDPQQNVVVLFGGFGGDGWVRNDTWIFSLTNRDWTEVHPSTTPISRYGHVMCAYIGHQDDTWEYDVSSNTWTRIITTGNPDRLKWPSMTYDSVNQKSILFGGQVGDTPVDGTWIYDAQLNTWTDAEPDVAPSGRINTGLAFDPRYNVTVLFGGMGPDWGHLNDTWAYSYDANTWTDMEGIESPSTPTTPTGTNTPPPETIPIVLLAIIIMAPVAIVVMVVLWRFRS